MRSEGGASVFRTEILEGAEKKWAAKPPTSCLSASPRLRVNKFRRSRRPLREPIPARLSASKSMGDRIAPVASEIARRQFDPRRRLPPLIFGEHHKPLDPRDRVAIEAIFRDDVVAARFLLRSANRQVGKACVSTCE